MIFKKNTVSKNVSGVVSSFAVSTINMSLRHLLKERIEMFTGKKHFNIEPYETEELEDVHDLIMEYDMIMDDVASNTKEISPGHKNLWIVSQMYNFRRLPMWNFATIEEIDRLFNIHEELKTFGVY